MEAQRILDQLEYKYTPKYGSWLNMAEIELNVITSQCLRRRIDIIEKIKEEAKAWELERNGITKKINWQYTTEKPLLKLKRLYPSYDP